MFVQFKLGTDEYCKILKKEIINTAVASENQNKPEVNKQSVTNLFHNFKS